MKFIFHGGAREVGRSCIELQTNGERYLMDAGIKFTHDGFAYPEEVFKVNNIDAVFLSHAHLDHSGGLPLFEHNDLVCPIICTSQTKIISRVLLKDSYKVARIKHIHPAYERADIRKVWEDFKLVNWYQEHNFKSIKFQLYNAGHIPGSAILELEAEGKRVIYTGDFNTRQSKLMKPADVDYEQPVDMLICESTYGDKELPDRDELEVKLKKTIQEVVDRGGSVLIPVFALGRSQEILILLADEDFGVPMYLDGMCVDLTKKILANPSQFVDNKEKLAKAFFNTVEPINSPKERNMASEAQGIFITTSGMMEGGPAMHYLEKMYGDPNSAILMMGFQVKGTNGRHIFEEKTAMIEGVKVQVACQIEKFDFSGHLSRDDLKNFVKHVNPKNIAFVHGDPASVDYMVAWAKENTDANVYGPNIGDEIEL